ncbi:MAG TPA: toll/interleukin-1 receptor domain-containing protein [Thermoanaerobaculia bacterium]
MSYQVLISSTPKDRDLAENLAQSVRDTGALVLSVEQTPTRGEAIDFDLRRLIRKADEVVLILTDRSLNNPFLLLEMGAAFSLRKRLIPILVGIDESEIPPLIAELGYVRYANLRGYLSELEQRVRSSTSEPPVAAAH